MTDFVGFDYRVVYVDPVYQGKTWLSPSPFAGMSVLDIAKKDVPEGAAFWIIPADQFSPDIPFDSYYIDEEHLGKPDGYGGTYVPPPISK